MRIKAPATVEDLYRVPDDAKAELVEGEIVLMSPTGRTPSRAGLRISQSLLAYEDSTGTGHTYPDNTGFVVDLPRRKSFSPDVAFDIRVTDDAIDLDFVQGAPTFAVEIRSKNDYGPAAEKRLASKRSDYFAAGTEAVWDVDLLSEDVVRAYHADSPERPSIFRRGDLANAEPALPGWTMPVNSLFR